MIVSATGSMIINISGIQDADDLALRMLEAGERARAIGGDEAAQRKAKEDVRRQHLGLTSEA